MEDLKRDEQVTTLFSKALSRPLSRKDFFKWSGVTAAVMGFGISMNGCKSDTIVNPVSGVSFSADDIGVLNYAYALEQLEAAFYAKVISSFYSGSLTGELLIMQDIAAHEQGHKDFFRAAIPNGSRITDDLTFNFAAIDFTSRASVLASARAFEDTGVAAYNGIAYFISDVNYLGLAGKIVSVEARHSSTIRDLINPKSADFAGDLGSGGTIDPATGIEMSLKPSQVLPLISSYFTVTVNSSLP